MTFKNMFIDGVSTSKPTILLLVETETLHANMYPGIPWNLPLFKDNYSFSHSEIVSQYKSQILFWPKSDQKKHYRTQCSGVTVKWIKLCWYFNEILKWWNYETANTSLPKIAIHRKYVSIIICDGILLSFINNSAGYRASLYVLTSSF